MCRSCSISILYDFVDIPSKGDLIVLKDTAITVSGKCHYIENGKAKLAVITSSYIIEHYDDMLNVLDWFKDNFEILNFLADSEPESYYNLYRSIIKTLGWKNISDINLEDDALLNELRDAALAVLMVYIKQNNSKNSLAAYNLCKPWSDLLLLMVAEKRASDDLRLISVIKDWHAKLCELGSVNSDWIINMEDCLKELEYISKN